MHISIQEIFHWNIFLAFQNYFPSGKKIKVENFQLEWKRALIVDLSSAKPLRIDCLMQRRWQTVCFGSIKKKADLLMKQFGKDKLIFKLIVKYSKN